MNQIGDIFYELFLLTIQTVGPILIVAMVVGIIISIIQAATQINEQTLSFVPKLLVIGIMLVLFGSTILSQLQDFLYKILDLIKAG